MIRLSAHVASLSAVALLAAGALAAQPATPPAPAGSPPPAATAPAPSATATPAPTPATSAPAGSSIRTPLDDLGLRKEAIPVALQEAVRSPYSLQGLNQCSQIVTAVEALDVALGKDIDLPQDSGSLMAPSDLMDFAASSVIPFRGLIREVTGAGNRQRLMQEAVLAGFARRAFLKGYGRANYCEYPARPATLQVIAAKTAATIASLEPLCGPLPEGQKRSKKDEWLNSRKCVQYKRAKEIEAELNAPPAATVSPAAATTTPADPKPGN